MTLKKGKTILWWEKSEQLLSLGEGNIYWERALGNLNDLLFGWSHKNKLSLKSHSFKSYYYLSLPGVYYGQYSLLGYLNIYFIKIYSHASLSMALENCKLEMKSNTVTAVLCYLKLGTHHIYHHWVPGLHVLKILLMLSVIWMFAGPREWPQTFIGRNYKELIFSSTPLIQNVDVNTKLLWKLCKRMHMNFFA